MLVRINLDTSVSPNYPRFMQACSWLRIQQKVLHTNNVICDSIQLATEVVHHSYYSRCSWPCHASLFLWLLRKQRNNILTGVEEGGFAVGT